MARRYLLGFDVGSSSVKASLTDVDNGEIVASAFYPEIQAGQGTAGDRSFRLLHLSEGRLRPEKTGRI